MSDWSKTSLITRSTVLGRALPERARTGTSMHPRGSATLRSRHHHHRCRIACNSPITLSPSTDASVRHTSVLVVLRSSRPRGHVCLRSPYSGVPQTSPRVRGFSAAHPISRCTARRCRRNPATRLGIKPPVACAKVRMSESPSPAAWATAIKPTAYAIANAPPRLLLDKLVQSRSSDVTPCRDCDAQHHLWRTEAETGLIPRENLGHYGLWFPGAGIVRVNVPPG